MVNGDTERGSVMAGQSAGLVNEVLPVKALIEGIVAEAEATIRRNAAQIRPSAVSPSRH
jgi:enoyl-[acyl-carrier protein] reductase II